MLSTIEAKESQHNVKSVKYFAFWAGFLLVIQYNNSNKHSRRIYFSIESNSDCANRESSVYLLRKFDRCYYQYLI